MLDWIIINGIGFMEVSYGNSKGILVVQRLHSFSHNRIAGWNIAIYMLIYIVPPYKAIWYLGYHIKNVWLNKKEQRLMMLRANGVEILFPARWALHEYHKLLLIPVRNIQWYYNRVKMLFRWVLNSSIG